MFFDYIELPQTNTPKNNTPQIILREVLQTLKESFTLSLLAHETSKN
jgi:hypothetical protein